MANPASKRRKLSPAATEELESKTADEDMSDESSQDSRVVLERATRSNACSQRVRTIPIIPSGSVCSTDLFQLQIDELLSKVRPDYERRMIKAENALRKLKTIIERIPNRGAKTIIQAEEDHNQSHSVRIPFPSPRPGREAKYTLAYCKPTNINVVGSYARKTAIQVGDPMTIDLAVTMPASIFQEKDYLNYRYFYKRAYYLACLAAGIEEDKENSFSLSFAYQDENKLQPVIIVNPGQGADDFSRSKCCIQIILAADEDLFSFVKTLPDKNCVRATLKSSSDASLPTPFYNSTLRSECSSLSYLKYLHSSSVQSAAFTDACVLGSVWLRQRGLGTSSSGGGFGPFEWSCTMAVLLQGGGHKGKPILSKGYSSYQLFKAMLQYLSVKDMVSSPTHVHSDAISGSKSDFPVLFDGERGLNILFKMSPWSYTLLRHEATCTINTFRDTLTNQFDACFITKLNEPVQKYDFVVKLPIKQLRSRLYHSADAIDEDFTFCNSVYQALRTGLDDRVVLVSMIAARMSSWTLEKPNDHGRHSRSIEIGLLLNPEHVNRSVDRGPSADDKEGAAQFRSFWGEKAELRRFKDGSIQESLIWSTSDTQNPILSQIISYIVSRHISEEAANAIGFVGGYFDRLLPIHKSNSFDPLTLYQPAMTAFEVLEQEIRNLEGLPLQIRQISAADPQLRYSSIEVPNLNSSHCKMEPANIFIQFEGSARWPDNLTAVQRTKMAFLLKMGELLEESTEGLSARLGLENTGSSILNAAFLDVVVLSGAFFRLRIHHERELNLLQYTLKDHCHTATIREETATALSTYKRSFLQAPVHTQAIRTLGTRFALLSPTVRLMKKWRDSQLLSHHISDELIELLTIHTFLHPHPWSIPGSLMAGFLRTLTFISKWDWHSTPLIVDSSGKMKPADIEAIHTRFEAWRKIDPAMNRVAIFAASNLDPDGITWTENNPSKVMAARFTSLAKVACTMVKERGLDIQPEVLFTHSLADYDFVIHLKEKYASGKDGQEKRALPNFKNLQLQAPEDKGLVGFNPIRMYVEDLRTIYRSNVVFFFNEQGGSIIAGLWNPATGRRAFKINLPYSTMPIISSEGEEAQITMNKGGTLHDIARLGGDLVSGMEVLKK